MNVLGDHRECCVGPNQRKKSNASETTRQMLRPKRLKLLKEFGADIHKQRDTVLSLSAQADDVPPHDEHHMQPKGSQLQCTGAPPTR